MRVKVQYRQASVENYKRFKAEYPQTKVDYYTWSNIIYTFNYNQRDYCLETGDKVKLPWGFGELATSKKKTKKTITDPSGIERINLPINWKRTKELGKRIYHFNFHSDGFKLKWKWFVKTARFKSSKFWVFKPSRVSSRMIKHYITQDTHEKYKEWSHNR